MTNEICFLLLALCCSIVSGTIGLGNALLLIPFSTLLFPIKFAIPILTIYFMASNISKITIYRKNINWKIVLLLWLGGVPAVYLGAVSMASAPSMLLKKILAVTVIVLVIVDTFKLARNLKINRTGTFITGVVSGYLSGLIGDSSAVRAPVFLQLGLVKESFIATMGCSSFLMNIIKSTVYSRFQLLKVEDAPLRKIRPNTFRAAVRILLVGVAVKLLFY